MAVTIIVLAIGRRHPLTFGQSMAVIVVNDAIHPDHFLSHHDSPVRCQRAMSTAAVITATIAGIKTQYGHSSRFILCFGELATVAV